MTSTAYEEDRRRRGFLVALLGGVLLLLLGLFGGWLAFGADAKAGSQALTASPSPSSGSGVTVTLPASQAAGEPVSQASSDNGNGNGNGGGSGNPGHPLDVSGVVVGSLAPGTPARLVVTVRNPNSQAVILTSVGGAITSVTSAGVSGNPACSLTWFHVGSFTGSRTIAKNASTSVDLPVTFDNLSTVNQDNCKGSQFTYSFTAQARQA